ncbi:MAG TPA: hypothetical protein DDY13_13115 [Cytophagales bacterium]|jgi:hypothetical protein|nr:hypothetical protein [Cytophagales bacterium]
MEGKEHYNDDDDKKRSDDDLNQNDDNDNFGLPDIEDSDQSDDLGYQPPKEEETSSFETGSKSSEYSTLDENDTNGYSTGDEENYGPEEEKETTEYHVHGLDDVDDRQTPVGLIIFLVIVVVAIIGLGLWWFFFRVTDDSQIAQRQTKPQIEQPIDTAKSEPVVEEPIIKDEPEPEPTHSGVLMLDSPTGRYYVVISSFVDDDLAMDYGKQLEKNGVATTILPPKQEKGFYRLAIADFVDLKDATLRAEEAKGQYGSEVWVIRY